MRAVTVVMYDCAYLPEMEFDVSIGIYNIDGKGRREYISAGERPLPTIYSVFSGLTGATLILWLAHCARRLKYVRSSHKLGAALLAFETINLAVQSVMLEEIRRQGKLGSLLGDWAAVSGRCCFPLEAGITTHHLFVGESRFGCQS